MSYDLIGLEQSGVLKDRATLDAALRKLHTAVELRWRTMRILRSAVSARKDQPINVQILVDEDFTGESLLRLIGSKEASAERWASVEGWANMAALLAATSAELAHTNAALGGVTSTLVRQLVGEPGKLLSGSEMAEKLGVSEEAVRQRHQAGKLIAVLREGRERGRGFPIFQAWDGVAGQPLEEVLKALGYEGPGKPVDSAQAFQFFIARDDLLGGFTPVEVLTGAAVPDQEDVEAAEFLNKPHSERLRVVVDLARHVAKARGQ